MEIADINYGLGKIDKIIYKDSCFYGFFAFSNWAGDWFRGTSYKVPDDFVNGRLKIVIE